MYECIVCATERVERTFEDATLLRCHVAVDHLRLLPFACLHCDEASAAVAGQLRPHYERRHPERLFQVIYTPCPAKEAQLENLLGQSGDKAAAPPKAQAPPTPAPAMPPWAPQFFPPPPGLMPFGPMLGGDGRAGFRMLTPMRPGMGLSRFAVPRGGKLTPPFPASPAVSNASANELSRASTPVARARKSIARRSPPAALKSDAEEEEDEVQIVSAEPTPPKPKEAHPPPTNDAEEDSAVSSSGSSSGSSEAEEEEGRHSLSCRVCGVALRFDSPAEADPKARAHLWTRHATSAKMIRCPVLGCDFGTINDIEVVASHLRLSHPAESNKSPVDNRGLHLGTMQKRARECFPGLSLAVLEPKPAVAATPTSATAVPSPVASPAPAFAPAHPDIVVCKLCSQSWRPATLAPSVRLSFRRSHAGGFHLASRGPFACPDASCTARPGPLPRLLAHLNDAHKGKNYPGPKDRDGRFCTREQIADVEKSCFGLFTEQAQPQTLSYAIKDPKLSTRVDSPAAARLASFKEKERAALYAPPAGADDKCRECGKTYSSPNGRKAHVWTAHLGLARPPLRCPVCSFGDSVSPQNVSAHIARAHPGKGLTVIDDRDSSRELAMKVLQRCFPRVPVTRTIILSTRAPPGPRTPAKKAAPSAEPVRASLGGLRTLVQAADALVKETPTKRARLGLAFPKEPEKAPEPEASAPVKENEEEGEEEKEEEKEEEPPTRPRIEELAPDAPADRTPEKDKSPSEPTKAPVTEPRVNLDSSRSADGEAAEDELTVSLARLSSMPVAPAAPAAPTLAPAARPAPSPAVESPSLKSLLKRRSGEAKSPEEASKKRIRFDEEIRIQSIPPRETPHQGDEDEEEAGSSENGSGSEDEEEETPAEAAPPASEPEFEACKLCSSLVSSPRGRASHVWACHLERKDHIRCPKCPFFDSFNMMKVSIHIKRQHGQEAEMRPVDDRPKFAAKAKELLLAAFPPPPSSCRKCESPVEASSRDRHVWETHVQVLNLLKCPACFFTSSCSVEDVRAHFADKHSSSPLPEIDTSRMTALGHKFEAAKAACFSA